MKKLFRIKLELIQLIVLCVFNILVWNIHNMDYQSIGMIILIMMSVGSLVFSIIAYKPIKEFRKEILKRW